MATVQDSSVLCHMGLPIAPPMVILEECDCLSSSVSLSASVICAIDWSCHEIMHWIMLWIKLLFPISIKPST